MTSVVLGLAVLMTVLALPGCSSDTRYNPELATRPYPYDLHTVQTVDIQVFRDGTELEVVNSTGTTYRNFELWVNQRYVREIAELPAGKTIRVSLVDFYDEVGEALNAGGFFRTRKATPIRLVEIQTAEDAPMIGLIAIRTEDVRRRAPVQ